MTKLTVDESLPAQLAEREFPAELCDASGRVIGAFIPVAFRCFYEDLEPQVSEEELERRSRDEGGRSLAEILADLEKSA